LFVLAFFHSFHPAPSHGGTIYELASVRVYYRPEPNIRGTMGFELMFITAHFVTLCPVTLFYNAITPELMKSMFCFN
jgi:hypothetical protein